MEYKVINLEEKTVVGVTARTNNNDADMPQIIGGLWQNFYTNGIHESIQGKKNTKLIGLYSDYEDDMNSDYNVTICCETGPGKPIPEGTVVKTIPAGKYAMFVVKGHVQKDVAKFWQELWSMDLDRAYVCDFEEYQNDGPMENCEIHMYIGLK